MFPYAHAEGMGVCAIANSVDIALSTFNDGMPATILAASSFVIARKRAVLPFGRSFFFFRFRKKKKPKRKGI